MKLPLHILLLAFLFFATQTMALTHGYDEEHLSGNEANECQSPLHQLDGETDVNAVSIIDTPKSRHTKLFIFSNETNPSPLYLTIRAPPQPSI
ncbi:MAG: hypothetical protein COB61_012070 [Thiotrichales bacterium]|nr:hypothetical protein [Thiotrichales bacterium]